MAKATSLVGRPPKGMTSETSAHISSATARCAIGQSCFARERNYLAIFAYESRHVNLPLTEIGQLYGTACVEHVVYTCIGIDILNVERALRTLIQIV